MDPRLATANVREVVSQQFSGSPQESLSLSSLSGAQVRFVPRQSPRLASRAGRIFVNTPSSGGPPSAALGIPSGVTVRLQEPMRAAASPRVALGVPVRPRPRQSPRLALQSSSLRISYSVVGTSRLVGSGSPARSSPSASPEASPSPAAYMPSVPVFEARSKRRAVVKDAPGGREGAVVASSKAASSARVSFAAAPATIPTGDARFQLISSAFHRSRAGVRMSEAEKAAQVTWDDVQSGKKEKAADWLMSVVPPDLRDYMLGGDLAVAQTPDPSERDKALREQFLLKAGPDGSALGKCRRFLELLDEMAPGYAMPAGRLLVHRTILRGSIAALSSGVGSQGGSSVAASLRTGALTAFNIGFPVDADNLLVDAAAPPQKKRRRERRSGSAPIKWYCHAEELCRSLPPGTPRLVCRQQTLAALHSRLRQVDVTRATVRHGGFAADGTVIVMVVSSFSKDGAPIDIYFRAEGFLGRFEWIEEHLRDVLSFEGYCIPAFKCPKGHAGDVMYAVETFARTASKDHSIKAFKALMALPPLCATAEVWKELGITPHFSHGSASDMAAVIGPHAPEDVALSDIDERELGHWRRLAKAATEQDGELILDDLLKESLAFIGKKYVPQAGSSSGPQPPAAQPAMRAEDAAMRVRYTSGTNREGRKRAQVRVHLRWVTAVRRALAKFGDWRDLKGDRSDYDILEDIPEAEPQESGEGGSSSA